MKLLRTSLPQPQRSHPTVEELMKEQGVDPYKIRVSCWATSGRKMSRLKLFWTRCASGGATRKPTRPHEADHSRYGWGAGFRRPQSQLAICSPFDTWQREQHPPIAVARGSQMRYQGTDWPVPARSRPGSSCCRPLVVFSPPAALELRQVVLFPQVVIECLRQFLPHTVYAPHESPVEH